MTILEEYMPKEEYLIPAWLGCLRWAVGDKAIVERFEEETGFKWTPSSNAMEQAIDEACGMNELFATKFAAWMNENIWGDIEDAVPLPREVTE